ncbi:uridine diphosphate-N-acetylglucosamine-binding protein YvcK [Acidiferrimicrobium sp. IK]|uniref:gluconeogenesis factor YvcK family protein n=1 Tax=Acidiferrimicrobium sp. IK TaxID=2871700 RepID=UPI0021CB8210|nr:uridine diphosphate-N-acetylglucosamine-binding protein YvcK [Acidiferrimicrobium sp. IK]MCU4183536.1 uridine diphosphate-N-acetylglucosamine-binding protein YvcK [Acidiferrimicrobium sp. IK]
MSGGPRVVAIGGGHGLSATLRAARTYAGDLTAIVSVADDGGSSGRLRRQFAIPAPGDLRRCLVAVAEPNSPWAGAFEYRFPDEAGGDLAGHALGNLIIAGLAGVTGEFAEALRLAAELLNADAQVLPATVEAVDLVGSMGGVEVRGQVRIQEAEGEVRDLHVLPPDAPAPAAARDAIARADQVILGPGSLFTSVLAACVVPDIAAALAGRAGGRVYVCNLRPEIPETTGYRPLDHLQALVDHGINVDAVLCDPRWWGAPDGEPPPELGAAGPRLLTRDLALDPYAGHDAGLLAEALRSLL